MSRWAKLFSLVKQLAFDRSEQRRIAQEESKRAAKGLAELAAIMRKRRAVEPPPIQTARTFRPKRKISFQIPEDDDYTPIELLGRDASYDKNLLARLSAAEVRVVSSSNVYSYAYEAESQRSGTLFVTFLHWEPGMKPHERSGAGATYAYYDFPLSKFESFQAMAAESAGKAVWDFCRVRGTVYGHQHRYRLISVSGDYVPRKATAKGFAARALLPAGLSPLERKQLARIAKGLGVQPFKRNTLAPEAFGEPNRGRPNRGRPNRGRP